MELFDKVKEGIKKLDFDYSYKIDGEDSYISDYEEAVIEIDGKELIFIYEVEIYVKHQYDEGDWWTPPSSDCEITDVKVTFIGEFSEEIEFTEEEKEILDGIVEDSIYI